MQSSQFGWEAICLLSLHLRQVFIRVVRGTQTADVGFASRLAIEKGQELEGMLAMSFLQ